MKKMETTNDTYADTLTMKKMETTNDTYAEMKLCKHFTHYDKGPFTI